MPAVQDHGDVDVQDVAVLQLPLAGNAVADDVVDRGADRLRIAAIVQRRRHRAMRDDEVVAQLVQRAGRHARPHMRGDHVQRLGRQPAGGAHPGEVLRRVDRDASRVGPAVHRPWSPSFRCRLANAAQDAQPRCPTQGQRRSPVRRARRGTIRRARRMIIDMHTHAGRPEPHRRRRSHACSPPCGTGRRRRRRGLGDRRHLPMIRRDPDDRDGWRRSATPSPANAWTASRTISTVSSNAGMRIAREPADIRDGDPALVLAIEGCDFLDGDLDRLDAMEARGVRSHPVDALSGERNRRHPDRAAGAWRADAVRRRCRCGG